MGIRCADHVTPLYPKNLALTSPTGGGRSVGIVSSRTKAKEFFLTGCNRRNGPDFETMFLRSNYTDITQNTYIQSSMVTEILDREV